MQYIAGRVGQEYNQRKNRKGAFWQDRYHATAIESGDHLWQCLVYVDLNMVRAGMVDHPAQWQWSGYNEIQCPKARYRLIDHNLLQRLLNVDNHEQFAKKHKQCVDNKLTNAQTRQEQFTQSVAVGSEAFIAGVQAALGIRSKGRKMTPAPDGAYQLRDSIFEYGIPSSKIDAACIENHDEVNLIPWSTSSS